MMYSKALAITNIGGFCAAFVYVATCLRWPLDGVSVLLGFLSLSDPSLLNKPLAVDH